MLGMPKPGEKITLDDAAKRISELASMARQYPTGQPRDVMVILTDEQWMAIMGAVGAIVVHQATEGAPQIFPAWHDEAQRSAMEVIYQANVDTLIGG
jgi:hypothetical protein